MDIRGYSREKEKLNPSWYPVHNRVSVFREQATNVCRFVGATGTTLPTLVCST